jgi:hypothetical protein
LSNLPTSNRFKRQIAHDAVAIGEHLRLFACKRADHFGIVTPRVTIVNGKFSGRSPAVHLGCLHSESRRWEC